MIFSTDSYYNIEQYNGFIEKLKTKEINFNEYLNIKNYKFYLETDFDPIILDYDEISKNHSLFLVSKTKPLTSQEEYLFRRKTSDSGKNNLKYVYNDAYNDFKNDYVYFINVKSKNNALRLSKELGKIYYFGRYYSNKFRIGLTNNQYIKNLIPLDDILASGSLLDAEMQLNYEIFKLKDRLRKYTQTPLFKNGEYFAPKILASEFRKQS